MILNIIGLLIGGVIVGGLGRLAIPGPNPMSLPMTALVGVGGSLVGGLAGHLLFGRSGLLLSILGAALIVWLMQRNQRSSA